MIITKERSPPTHSGATNSDRLNRTAPIGEIIQIIINKNLKSKVMKTAQLNGSTVNGKSEVKTTQPVSNGIANKLETKAEGVKDIAQSMIGKPVKREELQIQQKAEKSMGRNKDQSNEQEIAM